MDHFAHDPFAAITDDDAPSSASDRRNLRDSLLLVADLTIGRRVHQVRVRNLSSGGLMAEFTQPVAIGTLVEVALRGVGQVAGQVAWTAAGRIGIALAEEIDPMAARKPVSAAKPGPAKAKPIKPLF